MADLPVAKRCEQNRQTGASYNIFPEGRKSAAPASHVRLRVESSAALDKVALGESLSIDGQE
jgi:hypothetical protein